tara:strand:+ start:347 stop:691 length:345 start_codon:yes stop_codon:yes gene_type:complete
MRLIGILIIIGMVIGAISTIDYNRFIDLPSMLLVTGGSLGYVLAKGKSTNFIKNFGDGSVYMGWIGLMIGVVMIGNHHVNTENIWPAISVAFLPILYGYFIKLISTGLEKINNE